MAAGDFISATLDLGDVEAGFKAMERRARALGPAFRDLRGPLRDDQKSHARHRMGPNGAWPRRAPSTIARHGNRKKLLGRLPGAVTYGSNENSVWGESKVGWSEAHNEGATVGHGSRLRPRTFLWLGRKVLDTAEDLFERVMLAAFGGG